MRKGKVRVLKQEREKKGKIAGLKLPYGS
jgi:hypothetical protein